ncbi:MAG TPA: PPC domain-containing DNA-binding protein [Chloroflexota bacterium]|nr:PPC domain-containing DNA-binding protein [Chloroflexota bacterium]
MEYQEFGGRFVVRLESGEPVIETLTKFLADQQVGFANVSAAGAVKAVRLGYWNAQSKQYQYKDFDEQLETVSFQGNSSLKEGKPFLHIHGVFGRSDYSVVGGHVKEAWTHPTFEIWLRVEDMPVRRAHDDATGLDLLDLAGMAGARP